MIGAVLAYRNEREDTHSPSIDTVTVGHGADQHSQLSMMILLQRSHTETIIGIEREKRESGELCYTLMAAAAERAHENGIDRRHTFRAVVEWGSNGEVWAERRAGLPMTSLKRERV